MTSSSSPSVLSSASPGRSPTPGAKRRHFHDVAAPDALCRHIPSSKFRVPSPAQIPNPPVIKPTPLEEKVLDVVRATCKHYELKTTPRVAGGWVRDKLMGRDSHDLDIALDDCNGEAFALKVKEYLDTHLMGQVSKEANGEALSHHHDQTTTTTTTMMTTSNGTTSTATQKTLAASGISASSPVPHGKVTVVRANPDQSKHLATAMIPILGLSVDFVNLRAETYDGNSRIPQITIGTPEQDAERRDFTINSLFYNVHTREVEDFTGRGLEDLRKGVLRTPLPSSVTFQDDPLRMLRGIRFASRLAFALDGEVCAALCEPGNVEALRTKVSNERVAIELMACLRGPRPVIALELFLRHGLCSAVFKIPSPLYEEDGVALRPLSRRVQGFDWEAGVRVSEILRAGMEASKPELAEDRAEIFLAALLFPLGGNRTFVKNEATKNKPESCLKFVLGNSLKLGNPIIANVNSIVLAAYEFLPEFSLASSTTTTTTTTSSSTVPDQVKYGRLLYQVQKSWLPGLWLACAVAKASRVHSRDQIAFTTRADSVASELERKIRDEWNLDDSWGVVGGLLPKGNDPVITQELKIPPRNVAAATSIFRDFAFLNMSARKTMQGEAQIEDFFVRGAREYLRTHWRPSTQ